jgi:hypothetical protein
MYVLSSRTSIPPDIPFSLAPLLPFLADRRARDALIITIVPLSYILRDLDPRLGACAHFVVIFWVFAAPW